MEQVNQFTFFDSYHVIQWNLQIKAYLHWNDIAVRFSITSKALVEESIHKYSVFNGNIKSKQETMLQLIVPNRNFP